MMVSIALEVARPLERCGVMGRLPKHFLVGAVAAVALAGLYQAAGHLASALADSGRIEVWHGSEQRVGHLGDAQDDFNLLGRIPEVDQLFSLQYGVGDATPVELNFRAYRRLAADGHFNADIPIASLAPGPNRITLEARFADGAVARRVVTVTRMEGASPLPFAIDWAEVSDPQDVGQYVDGEWRQGEHGLRPAHVGYDRLFLIGERDWQDYEVTAEVTLHRVTAETAPSSGGNGLGLIMRFAGHSVGGGARFPVAQPKWGYQPLGAIAWLRWQRGDPDGPAVRQFFGGGEGEVDHVQDLACRRAGARRLGLAGGPCQSWCAAERRARAARASCRRELRADQGRAAAAGDELSRPPRAATQIDRPPVGPLSCRDPRLSVVATRVLSIRSRGTLSRRATTPPGAV
jgi:hypothetical protein